ncbi:hypothetical protein LIER_31655 [Lithospermum erythrorhizon]|uniref:Uncharacterized protein n=1 Tax=Lithospermum erythrorhizon TaxID=34254 RepID=A0AAV3RVL4_LITER
MWQQQDEIVPKPKRSFISRFFSCRCFCFGKKAKPTNKRKKIASSVLPDFLDNQYNNNTGFVRDLQVLELAEACNDDDNTSLGQMLDILSEVLLFDDLSC